MVVSSMYVGEVVTSFFKPLSTGNTKKVLMYSTIYGSVGSLSPVFGSWNSSGTANNSLTSSKDREQLETMVTLESLLMKKDFSLVGRDVEDYRSLFVQYLV